MTTMTKAKKTKAPAPKIVAGEGYKEIGRGDYSLADIEIGENFRKTFNEKALKELAENVAKAGVLQPVILRRKDRGQKFLLVAGERRYRAAKMAGLTTIPGRVLELTEEQALEVQALENLHRKDLSPIEEARAFKVLLDQKGHTLEQVQDLADRVGKSVNYVYRAVRLLELPKNVLEKIESGEWTPAHGHQLLRVPKEKIKDVITACENSRWNDCDSPPTAAEFKSTVDEELGNDLTRSSFPKDTEYAGRPACSACVFNSGNQGQLFDGVKDGTCSNRDCFEIKEKQHKEDTLAKIKEKYGANFLGVSKGYILSGSRAGGGIIIGSIDDKETKSVQKDPETKYIASEHGKIYVIHNDKAVIKKVLGYLPGGGEASGTVQGTTPKQKFIRMETYKALFQAARLTCAKGLTNEHYQAICEQMEPGHYNTKIPLELMKVQQKKTKYSWQTEYAYDVMTTDELRDLALLLALNERCGTANDPDPKVFMAVGVDAKTVMAKAKKDAEAAWDAQKGKKPAKVAK